FEQLQLTCTNGDNDNGNTAMLKATASGESGPYSYLWDVRPIQIAPGNPSLAIGLKAHLWYFIDVTDVNGCVRSDSVFTKAFYNPKVDIISTPDTAFIQKPYVQYEFENLSSDSISIESNYWEFGDETERSDLPNPLHIYTEVGDYTVFLTVFNSQGCDTIFSKVTKVLPVKLKIPNVITPNGDNINDVLIITEAPAETETEQMFKSTLSGGIRPLSAYYKKTSLVIFNRQGSKVYESINYDNDWGGSGLADGVYFYVLQCEGFKSNDVYRGSITIIASGN
ncbi:MAG: gliding motility-associated C-terminal domain-containing protein, partial [Ignavibacteria bacterium]|nr:gliding motility-associated C-terminal domain-containing protein [Ignavibacteria bacterium]